MRTLKKSFPVHKYGRFPRERDAIIRRWWMEIFGSFWIPIKLGIVLMVIALLSAALEGAIVELMRIATFPIGSRSLLVQMVIAHIGGVIFVIGLYNFYTQN